MVSRSSSFLGSALAFPPAEVLEEILARGEAEHDEHIRASIEEEDARIEASKETVARAEADYEHEVRDRIVAFDTSESGVSAGQVRADTAVVETIVSKIAWLHILSTKDLPGLRNLLSKLLKLKALLTTAGDQEVVPEGKSWRGAGF